MEQICKINIIKATGETELFDPRKLERSLFNAGASESEVREITDEICGWIRDGVSTQKIYAKAFSLLRSKKSSAAPRYRLKQALSDFGETGYPFEHLIGDLFERQGYSVEVGVVVEGNCVTHEMDVIATKEKEQCLVECKYSTDTGKYVSVQVPLYVRSRVDDIIKKRSKLPGYKDFTFSAWVVSSKRFSPDSLRYGTCAGLNLLSWDYPAGNGLKDLLERERIFPITLLTGLTKQQKEILLDKGIVTCSKLMDRLSELDVFELGQRKISHIVNEINLLTRP
jgi:hypothetical protein